MLVKSKPDQFDGLTFSEPAYRLVVGNWPAGHSRTVARFLVRQAESGLERCYRRTTGKDKVSPWGVVVRVVRGSDGKHYVVGRQEMGQRFIQPARMRSVLYLDPSCDCELKDGIDDVLSGESTP